jgi:hypothetical protein
VRGFAAAFITPSVLLVVALVFVDLHAFGQVRGVYPLGMSATNSGVTPEAGFSYGNNFLFYARDEEKGPNGEVVATGHNSVLMDMNSFIWVSKTLAGIPGKPAFSASATLPFANNSLTSALNGAISGGGGFADSYYQPLIFGWQTERADVRAIYGFLAPTGRFVAGATDNVGNGYWTNVLASGQTIYLTQNKRTAASAFEMYEWHTTQEGTGIHPGDTFDLDYSVTRVFPVRNDLLLQLGVVGYEQFQTTNKTGPNITPTEGGEYYVVHSLGFATNVMLPSRKVNLGLRYFKEFEDRSTYQGYSIQITVAVKF